MVDTKQGLLGLGAVVALAAAGYLPFRGVSEARRRADLWESRWAALRSRPASLMRYAVDDQRLRAEPRVPGRVVFLGASVTEAFDLARRFPGAAFVNRGVSGQLVWQELLRLDDDVLSYGPEAIIPEVCATNFDRAAPTITETQHWWIRIVERAREHGVRPLVATVIPVTREFARTDGGPEMPARIAAMNAFIREYARAHGDSVIDWAAALDDGHGALRDSYTDDGLHPNDAGYARMAEVVRRVVAATPR